LVALLFAWLMVSARGHAMLDRWRSRHRRTHEVKAGGSAAMGGAPPRRGVLEDRVPHWAVINLPGPFYLLALGKIAQGSYSVLQQGALILLFNAIMFLLLEVPLVGYLVRPETTAMRVRAMSRWLNANGLRITG
jgi:hypothetical protein